MLQNIQGPIEQKEETDVENAGGDVQYGDDGTVGSVVDGDLISAKHPAFTDQLIDLFLNEIESSSDP